MNYKKNVFSITNDEYAILDKKFGKLCYKAAWDLMRRNQNRSSYFDIQDVISEIKWSMIKAGMYFKRQTYIENSLLVVRKYCKDEFNKLIVNELSYLWDDRKHHGANKKRFGDHQEMMLDKLLFKYVPAACHPDINASLIINNKSCVYVKAIIWNQNRFWGKKFTKDNYIRSGSVSLSDKDFII